MSEADQTTLELIHGAGMREFLEKGYKSASLRNIVKTAGVTTGAFYGYYDSKEELFEALVKDQYDWFFRLLSQCTAGVCRFAAAETAGKLKYRFG